ncbi:unnamed protein product [Ectocarpus fasciculatus]
MNSESTFCARERRNQQKTMNTASALIIGGMALLKFGGFVPVHADSSSYNSCSGDFSGTCTAPEVLDVHDGCDGPCTEAECCRQQNCDLFSGTLTCQAPLLRRHDNDMLCDAITCTAEECCEAQKCDRDFDSSDGCADPLVLTPVDVSCAADCTAEECCTEQTCRSYVGDYFTTLCTTAPLPTTTTCAAVTCTDAECCEPPTCRNSFSEDCADPLVLTPHDVSCAGDCTAEECCTDQTCGSHVEKVYFSTLCDTTPLPTTTKCAAATCTDAECCEFGDPDDDFDGAIGFFSTSSTCTVIGAVAAAIVAVPLF